MLLRWIKGLRSPTASTMLSKVVVIVLALALLYQLHFLILPSDASHAEITSQRMSLNDGTQADLPSNGAQYVGQESKLEVHDALPTYTKLDSLLVDSSEPPGCPSSHKDADVKPSIASDLPDFDRNRTFHSYGPQDCFPSFNTTMQRSAFIRRVSCEKSAPFPVNDTYRVAFATASTGSALSPAYELAIHSQMTHSIIHKSAVHMLCADLVPGIWNKVAFLLNLVTNELLKPASTRLDWILWADRDTLILDACRPLSSFLPPQTPEFDKVDFIAIHDAYGLNYGVFFFRPTTWALDFFTSILAYPHYNPDDDLVFAEQSAAERLLAAHTKYGDHFARVPWHWFNAYPPEGDGSTDNYVYNTAGDGYEWFRPRKGDFLAHFAGHAGREDEMRRWGEAVREGGDVWACRGEESRRDVGRDVGNYWRAWSEGTLTDGMRSGESVGENGQKQEQENGHED